MSKSKRPEPQVEFFLSKKGIVREVLERETLKYLDDAEIRRAELDVCLPSEENDIELMITRAREDT